MMYTTIIPIVLNLMRILFRPNHQGHVCMILRCVFSNLLLKWGYFYTYVSARVACTVPVLVCKHQYLLVLARSAQVSVALSNSIWNISVSSISSVAWLAETSTPESIQNWQVSMRQQGRKLKSLQSTCTVTKLLRDARGLEIPSSAPWMQIFKNFLFKVCSVNLLRHVYQLMLASCLHRKLCVGYFHFQSESSELNHTRRF